MICNKILGKVTKFGEKRTKTPGVAEQIYGRGHNVPPPPPLGLYRVKGNAAILYSILKIMASKI